MATPAPALGGPAPVYGAGKPVHKRYRKYGSTDALLACIEGDLKQTTDERAVRKALLLIGQSIDGSPPSEALLAQTADIEAAVLEAPAFVRDTLLTWCVPRAQNVLRAE